jgi:hypothetical protein
MPRFKFIGDPSDKFSGPDVLELFGMKFPKGKPVGVKDKAHIAKLRGNSHFEEVSDDIATDGSLIGEEEPKRKGGWPKGKPRKPVESADNGE